MIEYKRSRFLSIPIWRILGFLHKIKYYRQSTKPHHIISTQYQCTWSKNHFDMRPSYLYYCELYLGELHFFWTTLWCTIVISRNLLNSIFIFLILHGRILQWNKLCQIVKGFKVENVCCCCGKATFFSSGFLHFCFFIFAT